MFMRRYGHTDELGRGHRQRLDQRGIAALRLLRRLGERRGPRASYLRPARYGSGRWSVGIALAPWRASRWIALRARAAGG